jgi:nuclease-like protein/AAA domain-containing protein
VILSPDLADVVACASSDAERRVARLLASIDGPAEAVAFHSVKLRQHSYKQQAEADFVVLWRGVLIVIEVKGGGVSKHDGVWYTVDRRGDWHKLATSPMEQAQSAMFALRDILKDDGAGWFAHEAMTITPDIDSPPTAVEWKSTHWLAKGDMHVAGLAAAFDAVAAARRTPPRTERIARTDDLRARLFGEFARLPMIDAQRGAVVEEQNRATAQQARLLASLARNQRILVIGGAGTGKSLALAEAAKQEAAAGRSVLLTFRSPALATFFAPLIEGRAIDCISFEQLNQKTYDVIVVDEAQDLMNADDMDRLDRALLGGRADGRWRMGLDRNNQAHVDGRFDPDVYELISDEALVVDLDLNVRNTKAIVHVVQEYLGADVGDPGIVHGERVQWHWVADTPDVDAALKIGTDLLRDGVRRDDIWIISVSSTFPPRRSPSGLIVTSPRFAKGLEAEHVIACDLPLDFDERGTAAFYVAITRARVTLHVVASGEDKRRLQQLARAKRGSND